METEEKLETNASYAKTCARKWSKALNSNGGIKDQYVAEQTAIILENYYSQLKSDPQLIAEDQIESSAFKGVNLAMLGVIRRTIPDMLVATELVGMQALPTPRSPIFYMSWVKKLAASFANGKGSSASGEELFGYPADPTALIGEADPYYSSSQVRYSETVFAAAGVYTYVPQWKPIVAASVFAIGYNAAGDEIARVHFPTSYAGDVAGTLVGGSGIAGIASAAFTVGDGTFTVNAHATDAAGIVKLEFSHEYIQEGNTDAAQLEPKMTESTLRLIRRMLKGKFSLDAQTDSKTYWGIDLENELSEMMRVEIMNEISREILGDLRLMAGQKKTVDYDAVKTNGNISGNYDDIGKYLADLLGQYASEIWTQGRLGKGNWAVMNPVVASYLDRFLNAQPNMGVSYDGKTVSFQGALANKIKIYVDPQYPEKEILMGHKGTGATSAGYIYAPYQLIQPTPTMNNFETGDPVKIFYTRYGKTWERLDPENPTASKQHIYRGEKNYTKVKLVNFPQFGG